MIRLKQHKRQVSRINFLKLCFFLAICTMIVLCLVFIKNLFLITLVAYGLSFSLKPLVNFVERTGTSRNQATLVVFLSFLASAFIGLYLLLPYFGVQYSSFKEQIPSFIRGISNLLEYLQGKYDEMAHLPKLDFSQYLSTLMEKYNRYIVLNITDFIQTSILLAIMGPFFAFFIIRDGQIVTRKFLSLVPNPIFETTLNLYHQINKQIGTFVRARLLEAIIVGGLVFMGLYLIDFPYAILLSLFVSLTNLVPYIGPIIGAIPGVLIALLNDYSGFDFVAVLLVYIIPQVIDNIILVPLLVARVVNLHPLTVIIILTVGAQFMGILGMLISIPLANAIKLTIIEFYEYSTKNYDY